MNSSVTPPVFGSPHVLMNNSKLYQIVGTRQSQSSMVLQIQKENFNYEIDNILVILKHSLVEFRTNILDHTSGYDVRLLG